MSEQTTSVPASEAPPKASPPPSAAAAKSGFQSFMSGSVGRNLGLVVALLLLMIVGAITAHDRSQASTTC